MSDPHLGIWIRDRQPTALDQIIGNEPVVQLLQHYLAQQYLPNLLFCGPHGSAKRTIATLFAKAYLGPNYSRAALSIDCAINRGKDTISTGRNGISSILPSKANKTGHISVNEFVSLKIPLPDGRRRLVILYNFDDMTTEAQNALRRLMETHERNSRFILICNQLADVIEPIQSRCLLLRTERLSLIDTKRLIQRLAEPPRAATTSAAIDDQIGEIIYLLSEGDLKAITNYTQTLTVHTELDLELVQRIFSLPSTRVLAHLLAGVHAGQNVCPELTALFRQGYNYGDLLEGLNRLLTYRSDILPDDIRYQYLAALTDHYCTLLPDTDLIHLYALFGQFYRISHGPKEL
jgi:DNA polymerase III delta prime subunit